MKTRAAYPSDLDDAEWAVIEPLLPPRRDKWGVKIVHERRELLNALFYVVRQGITWEALPHDFPPYKTVYGYFYRLNKQGLWPIILDQLRQQARVRAKREAEPSIVVLDSQSVKTTEKGGHAATTHTR